MDTVLSLFDYSGNWSKPYKEAGYHVEQIDLKLGRDIRNESPGDFSNVKKILIAVPCCHFASSGARWWKTKDADGRTQEGIELVKISLSFVAYWEGRGLETWALENPIGRIHKLCPELGEPKLRFDPCDYGDPYTKRTCLWGLFNEPVKTPVEPHEGSKMHRMSGRWKEQRSETPMGFARAFALANP